MVGRCCRDWESFVSFYDFPVEHRVHLRTTNPLESVFSSVLGKMLTQKRAPMK